MTNYEVTFGCSVKSIKYIGNKSITRKLKIYNTYYDETCNRMFENTPDTMVKRTYTYIITLTIQFTVDIQTV